MSYNINPENVARIAIQTMHDLSGSFDHMECVMGLVEAVGRIIVDAGKTPVEMQQIVQAADAHMTKVIKAGCQQKGFSI